MYATLCSPLPNLMRASPITCLCAAARAAPCAAMGPEFVQAVLGRYPTPLSLYTAYQVQAGAQRGVGELVPGRCLRAERRAAPCVQMRWH